MSFRCDLYYYTVYIIIVNVVVIFYDVIKSNNIYNVVLT